MKNLIILLGIGAMVQLMCSCSTKTAEKALETYKVITPLITDTAYTRNYVAEINAKQNVEIRSRIDGFIENIYVDEGQTVKQGQKLFTIKNPQFIQDLKSAKAATKSLLAELNAIEIERKGSKKLLDKNYISEAEYSLIIAKKEAVEAQLEEAQVLEEQAHLKLSFIDIKAPFGGILNRIPNKVGSLVAEGTLLTTISNNSEMMAYYNVSETDYLDFVNNHHAQSNEVDLILANGKLYPYKGRIETTESEFDKTTGTIAFRAKFPNPDQLLKHGATGKIQVTYPLKQVMLIPQQATFDRQENLCVYQLDKNNILHVKHISSSLRLPHCFVVSTGITPQDKIVYEGLQQLREGDKINPELASFNP